jgi:hypothetical protein
MAAEFSADAVARALLAAPVDPVNAERPPSEGGVPAERGFYAWWVRDGAIPEVPSQPHPKVAQLSLLYVGISPARESSSHLLRGRIVGNHLNGNTGSSTFRLTLAALLCKRHGWWPIEAQKKVLLTRDDNAALSAWQRANLALTWAARQRPWEIEHEVIAQMQPPLNLASNATHPFYTSVRDARTRFRQRARAAPR